MLAVRLQNDTAAIWAYRRSLEAMLPAWAIWASHFGSAATNFAKLNTKKAQVLPGLNLEGVHHYEHQS